MQINIKGVIVSNNDKDIYDWFGIESVSPKGVISALEKAQGQDVDVVINSGGGDVYAGSEIYTALKSHKGRVNINIVGIAASAASVIAMAGDKVSMSPTAQVMIHNVWSTVQGDYRGLEHEANVLKGHNVSIANAYMLKTGLEQKQLLKLMDNETYLNAQEALKYGFVDEIMFDEGKKLSANISKDMLSNEVIEKTRLLLAQQQTKTTDNTVEIAREKLNLLKLKEVK